MSNFELPQLLIVASHLDTVATRLQVDLGRRGISSKIADGQTSARMFTIRNGEDGSVYPDMPIFYRMSGWWSESFERSRDEEFLAAECYATFWAAANRILSPVINRPSGWTPMRRMTAGTICCLDATWRRNKRHRTMERYVSDRAQVSDDLGEIWGEDAMYHVLPVADFSPGVPIRCRSIPTSTVGYELVTVVGDKAFVASSDPRSRKHAVAKRSVKLARVANLHFCSLTWEITSSSAEAVRIDPAPHEHELRYRWTDIVSALAEDLLLC
jgi:hypothetical protein